jgi:hypothetical protein
LEWTPSHCSSCCVFGHSISNSACPKLSRWVCHAPDKANFEGKWTDVRKRRKGKEVVSGPVAPDKANFEGKWTDVSNRGQLIELYRNQKMKKKKELYRKIDIIQSLA